MGNKYEDIELPTKEEFRQYVKDIGLNQSEVATLVGKTERTISYWLKSDASNGIDKESWDELFSLTSDLYDENHFNPTAGLLTSIVNSMDQAKDRHEESKQEKDKGLEL